MMTIKRQFVAVLAIVSLIGLSAQAVDIHFNDYENETAAGMGIYPGNMGFTGAGGDLVDPDNFGISDANPSSGTYSYVIDQSHATPGANGWGGTWSGITTLGGPGANVVSPADAIANGTSANPLSYVDLQEGCTFQVSAMVATDALNPFVGDGHLNVHFELKDDTGATNLRTDASGIDIAPRLTSADLTTDYQMISHTYTLTGADMTAGTGLLEVVAVVSTDLAGGVGGGADSSAGLIYVDDFRFEVLDSNCFVTIVPEPGTGLLMVVAMMGLGFLRRR